MYVLLEHSVAWRANKLAANFMVCNGIVSVLRIPCLELMNKKIIKYFQRPRRAKFVKKRKVFSICLKITKNVHEAKTYGFGCHLEAILGSSWGPWEAFGAILGVLGLI